jgi:uncharacterized protein
VTLTSDLKQPSITAALVDVTSTTDDIAGELERAFATRDLEALGNLLADDARWGDDDASNKCRNRQQVVATFARLLDEGAEGGVDEIVVGPNGVLCKLHVDWPDAASRSGREGFYHLYVVRDGKIVEIRRYDDRESAAAALGESATSLQTQDDTEGHSPILDAFVFAIHFGDLGALERLIAEHPEMLSAPLGGRYGTRTLLHIATDWPGYFPNGPQAVRMLIAAGADPNARHAPDDETPLQWAASSDDADVAAALIDGGADLETPRGSIGSPLDNAIGYACWNVARLLVERGARVEKLWHAAALGMLDRLEELLDANHDDADAISQAFWHACAGGQRRAAERLLLSGADLNWEPEYAHGTPLDAASGLGTRQENVLTWLREQGAQSVEQTE